MKISKRPLIVFLAVMVVSAFVSAAFSITVDNTLTAAPVETEAPGGYIGTGPDELRCPPNLHGVGPAWNNVTVGKTSLQEMQKNFPLVEANVVRDDFFAGDYAPNYAFMTTHGDVFYVCIVDETVEGILVGREAVEYRSLPSSLDQWVSYLGEPLVTSWHITRRYRMLHWPRNGISITVELLNEQLTDYGLAEWVFLYPFRGEDYASLWPINAVILEQPYPTPIPQIPLDVIDYNAVRATISAQEVPWPSATPPAQLSSTEEP